MALSIDGTPQGGTASAASIVLPAFTTANANDIIVIGALSNADPITSITGGGLTFLSKVDGASPRVALWYAVAASPLSAVQFTVNFGSSASIRAAVFAISGADTTTPWDATAAATDVAAPCDPLAWTNTAADCCVVAVFRMASTTTPTAGSGWTQQWGANSLLLETKIVSAAGSNSASITTGNGNSNGGIVAGVVMAAGAGVTAAITGTATASITESDIVTGGKVVTVTLSGDTFIGN